MEHVFRVMTQFRNHREGYIYIYREREIYIHVSTIHTFLSYIELYIHMLFFIDRYMYIYIYIWIDATEHDHIARKG
jgi:hypothetical protein